MCPGDADNATNTQSNATNAQSELNAVPTIDNSATETHQMEFSTADRTVSDAILTSVGQASRTDPAELPVLYDVVDPDALDSIFSPRQTGGSRSAVRVTFEYSGYRVDVCVNGSAIVVSLR
jgi:hypothetical protein